MNLWHNAYMYGSHMGLYVCEFSWLLQVGPSRIKGPLFILNDRTHRFFLKYFIHTLLLKWQEPHLTSEWLRVIISCGII